MSITCNICFEMISEYDIDLHEIKCSEEQILLLKKYKIDILQLTPLQEKAISYAEKKSKIISKNLYLMILANYKFLGYTEDDLKTTIKFIQTTVPVVIHLSLDKVMKFLRDDTEYRNQFETGTSGGALSKESRIQWEKTLFGGIYDHSEGYEKVKYGALNITLNPNGICCGYGDSYLKLKDEVKKRITFVHGDSSAQKLDIATFSSPVPILNFLEKNELIDVIDVATGKKDFTKINLKGYYVEAQIHGPVRLNMDVDVLMVNKRHKNDQNMVAMLDEFSHKHNCTYQFIE